MYLLLEKNNIYPKMNQIEELESEVHKTRSELARMSEEYQHQNVSFEELVLKASELTEKCHEVKLANQLKSVIYSSDET